MPVTERTAATEALLHAYIEQAFHEAQDSTLSSILNDILPSEGSDSDSSLEFEPVSGSDSDSDLELSVKNIHYLCAVVNYSDSKTCWVHRS